jgi:hypothetical protein
MYSGFTFLELKFSSANAGSSDMFLNDWGLLLATAYSVAIFTSEAMKYRLSSAPLAAILLVVQEEMTRDPTRTEAVMRVNFFIGEVDCCLVIRAENP